MDFRKSFIFWVLIFLLSVVVLSCSKRKSQSSELSISPEELLIPEDIIKIIDEVQRPNKISIKKLTWDDIEKLNPVPAEEGGAFKAREGDIYVETEKIRAVIQSPSREIGPFTYGGNLIDVDIKREDGRFHDILGEQSLFVFLGQTLKPQKVGIFRDNVIVAYGELDLLDFINATGLFDIIGRFIPNFSLPFKVDEVKPLKVERYFVFSDQRWIKIIDVVCNTSDQEVPYFFFADMIDSGGDGEFYIPSSVLKGYGYNAPGLPFGLGIFSAKHLAFVSEKLDSSYGIFPLSDDNLAFIVSGVAVLSYGILEKNDPISTLIGVVRGNSEKLIKIQPNECVSGEKYFVVGSASPSSLADEFLKIISKKEGIKLFSVSGKVENSSGEVPGRVRIAVFDENKNFVTSLISGIYGEFSLLLPEGKYIFAAEAKYSQISEPKIFEISSDRSDIEIVLDEPAKISVEIVEIVQDSQRNIPGKISFICIDGCKKNYCVDSGKCEFLSSSFRDVTFDPLPEDVQEVVFSANGKPFDVYIPSGRYKLVVSRGMEYSRYETEFEVKSGERKSIKAFLYRIADSDGWLSTDTHVHSVNSPDSPVALIDRVITFAGEGVDIIISTDHDWLTDYEPAIRILDAQDFISSLVGQEITTFSYGHFNSYPVKQDNRAPSAGALDWSEKYDRPEKYGIEHNKEDYRFLRSLHPREIFKKAHTMKPDSFKRNVVQVNHPRSGGMGYFDYVKLDTKNFRTAADPCVHRIFPPLGKCGSASELGVDDTQLFVPYEIMRELNNLERFDAVELYNSYSEITAVINDWFTFLNHGIHITAVGCSDTHKKISDISGIGRTFVFVGKDKDLPSEFREDEELRNLFIQNLADGKVFVSNGIILEKFEICGFIGSSETCLGMGFSEQKRISPPFKLKLKVKSPDWIDFDTVRVFSNASGTAARSGYKVIGYPSEISEIYVESFVKEVKVAGFSFRQKYLDLELPINFQSQDFWVAVVVECSNKKCNRDKNTMFPVIPNKNIRPIMITNAIYVDFDGDGKFAPPPPTYAEVQRTAPTLSKQKDKSYSLEDAMKVLFEGHKH